MGSVRHGLDDLLSWQERVGDDATPMVSVDTEVLRILVALWRDLPERMKAGYLPYEAECEYVCMGCGEKVGRVFQSKDMQWLECLTCADKRLAAEKEEKEAEAIRTGRGNLNGVTQDKKDIVCLWVSDMLSPVYIEGGVVVRIEPKGPLRRVRIEKADGVTVWEIVAAADRWVDFRVE